MAELSSAAKVSVPLSLAATPPWAFALLAAALYPTVLSLFPSAVQGFSVAEGLLPRALWAGGATMVMALAMGVPLLALWALMKTPPEARARFIAARRLLHVLFAVPPLYSLSRLLAGRVELIDWHGTIWLAVAVAAALLVACTGDAEVKPAAPSVTAGRLRKVHAAMAIALFVGFLFVHVLNHGVALWSVELQESWMTVLRLWYRAAWVEPILLGGLAVMALSGIPMMLRNTRTGGNQWRTLQSTAGVYIIVFLCSHVTAVLTARADGRDTDWIFATGQNGLINGSSSLIPYYILSIATLMIHVALGVRMALLRSGVDGSRASRTFSMLMWFAGLTTLWVTAAILGVELGS